MAWLCRMSVAAIVLLLGCASLEPAEQQGSEGLSCDIEALLARSCAGLGCHGSEVTAAELDLSSPGVGTRLVDVPAKHLHIMDGSTARCVQGELLVDTANPDNSVVLRKVLGTQSCRATMPLQPRSISPSEIDCLRAWVYQLAGKAVPSGGGTGGGG